MSLSNKLFKYKYAALVVGVFTLSSSASAACVNPVVTPSTIAHSPKTGDSQLITAVTITLDCQPGDTYSLTSNSEFFTGDIGTSTSKVQASFHRNASATQPLWGSSISGSYTGTNPGVATLTVWTKLSSQGKTFFDGQGNYSVNMLGLITSPGSNPINVTHTGTIEGFCSIADASIDFGEVTSGTNPIYPIDTMVNCSKGMTYTISQSSTAPVMFGPEQKGYAWVFTNSAATQAIVDTPLQKTGLGRNAGEIVELYVRLDGMSRGAPIHGSGAFTSTIPLVVTY